MTDYMIKFCEGRFEVIDPIGNVVARFDTASEGLEEIRRCRAEDVIWGSAKSLVAASIQTLAEQHGLDHDTARRMINDAAEVAE
jgi:hypothetical protein